ncbi:hypothetical protein SHAb15599_00093 [Acinetobacter phage SH-Ab 15599]|nr:hypothetical protein SHAb15599_00093 [Acinetobacter phage SH-Ab 15599]
MFKPWFVNPDIEVRGFFKEYRFLSNMFVLNIPVEWKHIPYHSTEAAYQALKFRRDETKRLISGMSPQESKKFSAPLKHMSSPETKEFLLEHPVDMDFMKNRLRCMQLLNQKKFDNNPDLKELLLSTGSKTLIEVNWWHDSYWGTSMNGFGNNNLGICLMNVRASYSESLWSN